MTTPRKPTPEEMAVDLSQVLDDLFAGEPISEHLSAVRKALIAACTRALYAERRLERIVAESEPVPITRTTLSPMDRLAKIHAIATGTES